MVVSLSQFGKGAARGLEELLNPPALIELAPNPYAEPAQFLRRKMGEVLELGKFIGNRGRNSSTVQSCQLMVDAHFSHLHGIERILQLANGGQLRCLEELPSLFDQMREDLDFTELLRKAAESSRLKGKALSDYVRVTVTALSNSFKQVCDAVLPLCEDILPVYQTRMWVQRQVDSVMERYTFKETKQPFNNPKLEGLMMAVSDTPDASSGATPPMGGEAAREGSGQESPRRRDGQDPQVRRRIKMEHRREVQSHLKVFSQRLEVVRGNLRKAASGGDGIPSLSGVERKLIYLEEALARPLPPEDPTVLSKSEVEVVGDLLRESAAALCSFDGLRHQSSAYPNLTLREGAEFFPFMAAYLQFAEAFVDDLLFLYRYLHQVHVPQAKNPLHYIHALGVQALPRLPIPAHLLQELRGNWKPHGLPYLLSLLKRDLLAAHDYIDDVDVQTSEGELVGYDDADENSNPTIPPLRYVARPAGFELRNRGARTSEVPILKPNSASGKEWWIAGGIAAALACGGVCAGVVSTFTPHELDHSEPAPSHMTAAPEATPPPTPMSTPSTNGLQALVPERAGSLTQSARRVLDEGCPNLETPAEVEAAVRKVVRHALEEHSAELAQHVHDKEAHDPRGVWPGKVSATLAQVQVDFPTNYTDINKSELALQQGGAFLMTTREIHDDIYGAVKDFSCSLGGYPTPTIQQ